MRRFFIATALLLLTLVTTDAKVFSAVSLDINSETGLFKKGEKITFSARQHEPVQEQLLMTVYENGLEIVSAPVHLVEEPAVIYECSYDKAVSVIVKVGLTSDEKSFTSVGAVVAPEEFTPGFDEPEDFMEYWNTQISALRKAKIKASLRPAELPEGDEGYKAYALEVSMPEGKPVRGYLVMPEGAAEKSLPIVIYTHGAGVHKPGNRAHVKTALKHAKMGNGAISLDINAHGFPDDMPDEYYKDLNRGELKNYPRRPLTTRDEYYFRFMYLRLVRAMDYLCSLPEWDGERAAVLGESQGGLQSAVLACLDQRIKLAILTCPAHTDLAGPKQGRKSSWPGIYDIAEKSTPHLIDDILPYFDGANFLRHVHAKLIVEVGLSDMTSPPACVYAGYNVCPSLNKTMYGNPHRPHSGSNIHPEHIKGVKLIGWKKKKTLDEYLK